MARSDIRKLKAAFEKKLEHEDNFILKVLGSVGDLSKELLALKERVEKLEKKGHK